MLAVLLNVPSPTLFTAFTLDNVTTSPMIDGLLLVV